MSSGSLARRYARALMQIGLDDGSFERVGRDMSGLAAAMKSSPELTATLTNPIFPRDEREKVVRAVLQRLGASQTAVNCLRLLLDRERVAAVPAISRELDRMIDDHSGRISASVESAVPLTPDQQQQLAATLEKLTGKKVQVEATQNPELLGGVIAKVGDQVFDGSLRTQLRKLQETLTN